MPVPPEQKNCARCERPFECGLAAGHDACWCFELPHVMPINKEASCLCPQCLQAEIAKRTEAKTREPHVEESRNMSER